METNEIEQPEQSTPLIDLAEVPETLDLGTATVENTSVTGISTPSHPNDVKFKVSYPKNWEGEKTFEEGSVHIVSKESAEHFTSIKIGRVIK